jgi:hypothetical protein
MGCESACMMFSSGLRYAPGFRAERCAVWDKDRAIRGGDYINAIELSCLINLIYSIGRTCDLFETSGRQCGAQAAVS